jgi:hypothetical protein
MKLYYKCYGCKTKGEIGSFENHNKDFYTEGWRTDESGTRHQIVICNKCGAIHDVFPSLLKSPIATLFRLKIVPFVTNGYYLLSDITDDVKRNLGVLNAKEIVHYGYSLNDRVIDHMINKGFFDEQYNVPINVNHVEFLKKFQR